MFIDSHCHLDFPELRDRLPQLVDAMQSNQVTHALCIAVEQENWSAVLEVSQYHPNWYATAGVHPDYENTSEPDAETIASWAAHSRKIVAIGETGLDYYRLSGDLEWQRDRFRRHIQAAKMVQKPLVIHTRSSSGDTLKIMKEEGADAVGGVMHCFTESLEVAQMAMDMGFLISFSGIVTFKNARELKEVAKHVPLEKMLIETDSPYLAPVPFRGKTNEPAHVKQVAEEIARLKEVSLDRVGQQTSSNFFELFRIPA